VAIAYAPSLGKIAVFLPPALAERDISHASIHLNERGQFKVLPAPKEFVDVHEARALVGGKDTADIVVDRASAIPSFFARVQIVNP